MPEAPRAGPTVATFYGLRAPPDVRAGPTRGALCRLGIRREDPKSLEVISSCTGALVAFSLSIFLFCNLLQSFNLSISGSRVPKKKASRWKARRSFVLFRQRWLTPFLLPALLCLSSVLRRWNYGNFLSFILSAWSERIHALGQLAVRAKMHAYLPGRPGRMDICAEPASRRAANLAFRQRCLSPTGFPSFCSEVLLLFWNGGKKVFIRFSKS